MYIPTAKGYFSGCGGLELGMIQAGVKIIQSLDLDSDATNCMNYNKHYFSHCILNTDIRDKLVLSQPESDIILGTYPCTKYSTIADIHHTRTGDELFLHFFRHIAIAKPEMYVVENVPGMKKFKVVMEAITKMPDYYIHIFCPVDALNWLPKARKRLIVFGTRKKFIVENPKPNHNKPKLKELLENNPEVDFPNYILHRLNGKYRDKPIIIDADNPDAYAPTCVAHYAKDLGTRLIKDASTKHGVRPFSIREYARLQGFPDDFYFDNKRSSYRLIGNAVPVNMGQWIGEQAMRYFNNFFV